MGPIASSADVNGNANGAFNIPSESYINFVPADIDGLPLGDIAIGAGEGRTFSMWIKTTSTIEMGALAYGTPSN